MTRAAWIAVLAVVTGAAFALGLTVGGTGERSREIGPEQPGLRSGEAKRESDRVPVLLTTHDRLREELTEREEKIVALEAELAELQEKLPPPLTPEEEKKQKEEQERKERSELRKAREEKVKELRKKILQRKDGVLRQEGLAELDSLLRSENKDDLIVGLGTLSGLWGLNYDKEGVKPMVLAALNNEDKDVRRAALNCAYAVCSSQERRNIVFSMAKDSSPAIRAEAVSGLRWSSGPDPDYRDEEVASLLKVLVEDEDKNVRLQALDALSGPYDCGEEMEDLAIEMSKDKEMAEHMRRWMAGRMNISGRLAERLVEMYEESGSGYYGWEWARRSLSDEAKPIAAGFCVRIVRDSLEEYERREAVETLRRIGELSVLPELEEITQSNDAEGIEEELARTIEELRKRASQPR